jgi:hypothetical protein
MSIPTSCAPFEFAKGHRTQDAYGRTKPPSLYPLGDTTLTVIAAERHITAYMPVQSEDGSLGHFVEIHFDFVVEIHDAFQHPLNILNVPSTTLDIEFGTPYPIVGQVRNGVETMQIYVPVTPPRY